MYVGFGWAVMSAIRASVWLLIRISCSNVAHGLASLSNDIDAEPREKRLPGRCGNTRRQAVFDEARHAGGGERLVLGDVRGVAEVVAFRIGRRIPRGAGLQLVAYNVGDGQGNVLVAAYRRPGVNVLLVQEVNRVDDGRNIGLVHRAPS